MSYQTDSSSLNNIRADVISMQQEIYRCASTYNSYIPTIPKNLNERVQEMLKQVQQINEFVQPNKISHIQKEISELQSTLNKQKSQFHHFLEQELKLKDDHRLEQNIESIKQSTINQHNEIFKILAKNVEIHINHPPIPFEEDYTMTSGLTIKSNFSPMVADYLGNEAISQDQKISEESQAISILNQQNNRLNQLESNVSLIEIRDESQNVPEKFKDLVQPISENHKSVHDIQHQIEIYMNTINSPLKEIKNEGKVKLPKDLPQTRESFNEYIEKLSDNYLKMAVEIDGIRSMADIKLNAIDEEITQLENRIETFTGTVKGLNDELSILEQTVEESYDVNEEQKIHKPTIYQNIDYYPIVQKFQEDIINSKQEFHKQIQNLQNQLTDLEKSLH